MTEMQKQTMASIKEEKKQIKKKKLKEIFKAPIKILAIARDFYIQSLMACDGHMAYNGGGAIGCPTAHCVSVLSRSFTLSNNSSSMSPSRHFRNDGYKAVASRRSLDESGRRNRKLLQAAAQEMMPRSYSVKVGRIDEDQVCEFGEELMVKTRIFATPFRKSGRLYY